MIIMDKNGIAIATISDTGWGHSVVVNKNPVSVKEIGILAAKLSYLYAYLNNEDESKPNPPVPNPKIEINPTPV